MAEIPTGKEEMVTIRCNVRTRECVGTFQVAFGFVTTEVCQPCLNVLADRFWRVYDSEERRVC